MKTSATELERVFHVTLEAETVQEAATLARMAMNRMADITMYGVISKDGRFSVTAYVGINERFGCEIPRKGKAT